MLSLGIPNLFISTHSVGNEKSSLCISRCGYLRIFRFCSFSLWSSNRSLHGALRGKSSCSGTASFTHGASNCRFATKSVVSTCCCSNAWCNRKAATPAPPLRDVLHKATEGMQTDGFSMISRKSFKVLESCRFENALSDADGRGISAIERLRQTPERACLSALTLEKVKANLL